MSKSIVVSGPPAIGKTTVAQGLAKEFNLNYLSGGDILKELASEQGFSSSGDDWWATDDGMKFLNQRKENSEFDKKVDEKSKSSFLWCSSTKTWQRDNNAEITSKDGFSVVAPISVIVPSSTALSNESCCALLNR